MHKIAILLALWVPASLVFAEPFTINGPGTIDCGTGPTRASAFSLRADIDEYAKRLSLEAYDFALEGVRYEVNKINDKARYSFVSVLNSRANQVIVYGHSCDALVKLPAGSSSCSTIELVIDAETSAMLSVHSTKPSGNAVTKFAKTEDQMAYTAWCSFTRKSADGTTPAEPLLP